MIQELQSKTETTISIEEVDEIGRVEIRHKPRWY